MDVGVLNRRNKQYIEDLGQILHQWMPDIDTKLKEDDLIITLPENIAKREVRLRLRKYIHRAGLKNVFKVQSVQTRESDGYMIKEL